MKLDPNWNYKTLITNIKEFREEYDFICSNFKYKDLHQKVLYRQEIKRIVYGYPFGEKRKNNIWYYLHHKVGIRRLKGE